MSTTEYYVLEWVGMSQPADERLNLVSHLKYANDNGWGLSFAKGESIKGRKVDAFVMVESRMTELTDYYIVDGVPLVKPVIIDLLEEFKKDFQFFPTEVRFTDCVVAGFYLINVAPLFSVIDKENSQYTDFHGRIFRLKEMRLKSGIENAPDIFRPKEFPTIILISERVKHKLENAHVSGIRMRLANGWSDRHLF